MANVEGAPCWFELATSDQPAAKKFYTGLLGWTADDSPMGPGQFYTMFRLDGKDTGAAYTLMPDMAAAGVPPHWGVYFLAMDIDATTAKVSGLGGSVVNGPFDVMNVGRMSICKDPGGAVFCLWQPKERSANVLYGEDNSVCWTELATRDVPQARDFYSALLGWQTKGSENMATYLEFSVAGRPSGGLLPMDENWGSIPSHWGIYFKVADCDATIAKAQAMGAKVLMGPHDAPGVGRLAILDDPQGAKFSVIKLAASM